MKELIIDKDSIALVVIDLQKGIVAMPTEPYAANDIITNAVNLAKAFRKIKQPVFLVHVGPSEDLKDSLQPISDKSMQGQSPRPTDWQEIVPELATDKTDFIITKRQWGAFYGTELDLQLRRRKINTIVLCGISTDIGIESTARFAYEYGYNQIFAENACGARTAQEHQHTMHYIFPSIGRICDTQTIINAIT